MAGLWLMMLRVQNLGERDVELHEERDFCLCGVDGNDESC